MGRSTDGTVTTFPVPVAENLYGGILTGPHGNLWLASGDSNAVTEIAPDGTVLAVYPIHLSCDCTPRPSQPDPTATVVLGDQRPARADHPGRCHEPLRRSLSQTFFGITAGPDGAIWFTDAVNNRIERLEISPPR